MADKKKGEGPTCFLSLGHATKERGKQVEERHSKARVRDFVVSTGEESRKGEEKHEERKLLLLLPTMPIHLTQHRLASAKIKDGPRRCPIVGKRKGRMKISGASFSRPVSATIRGKK